MLLVSSVLPPKYTTEQQEKKGTRRIAFPAFAFIASTSGLVSTSTQLLQRQQLQQFCAFSANCAVFPLQKIKSSVTVPTATDIQLCAAITERLCQEVATQPKSFNTSTNMSLPATRIVAARAMARRAPVQQQKRGIVDYLTNYPDKVRSPCARLFLGFPA